MNNTNTTESLNWITAYPGCERAVVGYGEADSKGRELGVEVEIEHVTVRWCSETLKQVPREDGGRYFVTLQSARGGKRFGATNTRASGSGATRDEALALIPELIAKHKARYLKSAKR